MRFIFDLLHHIIMCCSLFVSKTALLVVLHVYVTFVIVLVRLASKPSWGFSPCVHVTLATTNARSRSWLLGDATKPLAHNVCVYCTCHRGNHNLHSRPLCCRAGSSVGCYLSNLQVYLRRPARTLGKYDVCGLVDLHLTIAEIKGARRVGHTWLHCRVWFNLHCQERALDQHDFFTRKFL